MASIFELERRFYAAIDNGDCGEVDRLLMLVKDMLATAHVKDRLQTSTQDRDLQATTQERVPFMHFKLSGVLHVAVKSGNVNIVEVLLNKTDADVNMVYLGRGTPLHVAVKLEPELAVRMCALLIDHGADRAAMNMIRGHWQTPLTAACEMSSSPCRLIKLLVCHRNIHHKGDEDRQRSVPHLACITSGNRVALEVLFEFEDHNGMELCDEDMCELALQSVLTPERYETFGELVFARIRKLIAEGYRLGDKWRWGTVLRVVYDRHYAGQECADWVQMLLNAGAYPIDAIEHAITRRDQNTFDQLISFVTPDVAVDFNSLRHTVDGRNRFCAHPLLTAANELWQLEPLLVRGLDPSSLQLRFAHSATFGAQSLDFFVRLSLFECRYSTCSLLSYLILRHSAVFAEDESNTGVNHYRADSDNDIGENHDHADDGNNHTGENHDRADNADNPNGLNRDHADENHTGESHDRALRRYNVQRAIEALLAHGAPANPEAFWHLPPLCALAFARVGAQMNQVRHIASILLRAGANPFYTSGCLWGEISSTVPDLFLIASLVGNVHYLRFLLSRVGYDAMLLMQAVEEQIWTMDCHLGENRERKKQHGRTGAALITTILPFTSKHNPVVRNSYANIGELMRSRLITSSETMAMLRRELASVQSLQSMARAAIRSQLQRTVNVNELMEAKVERIPECPAVLKSFLLFDGTQE